MRLKTQSIVSVVAPASISPGCGGGGAKVESDISTTTRGQQLMDLKKALDSGAINQKEYEALRKKVIET
jgi:hypothetical protein